MEPTPAPSYAIPVAIIFGFALIAGAIFYSGHGEQNTSPSPTAEVDDITATAAPIKPVDEQDFIRGNPNAPIMIVEYADYECVHCLDFHATMKQIMDDFGASGDVAWVFRQFPILGQSSVELSKAAYCMGNLGGAEAYYTFTDVMFSREPGTRANLANISSVATDAGIDKTAFENCLSSDSTTDHVSTAVADGQAAHIEGTPYSIVMVGDQQVPLIGAQQTSTLRGLIQTLLDQLGG